MKEFTFLWKKYYICNLHGYMSNFWIINLKSSIHQKKKKKLFLFLIISSKNLSYCIERKLNNLFIYITWFSSTITCMFYSIVVLVSCWFTLSKKMELLKNNLFIHNLGGIASLVYIILHRSRLMIPKRVTNSL